MAQIPIADRMLDNQIQKREKLKTEPKSPWEDIDQLGVPAPSQPTTAQSEVPETPIPTTEQLGSMREEAAQVRPGKNRAQSIFNRAVTGSQKQLGVAGARPPSPDVAQSSADRLMSTMEKMINDRPDFADMFQAQMNQLKKDRILAEEKVDDRANREQILHAIGKLGAGVMGLMSLQNRQSRGLNLGGLKFDKTDFAEQYNRLYKNYMADVQSAREGIGMQERAHGEKLGGISKLAGIEVQREEAQKGRDLRRELQSQMIAHQKAQSAMSRAARKISKSRAVNKKAVSDILKTKQKAFDSLRGIQTSEGFKELDADQASARIRSHLMTMGVPNSKVDKFGVDVMDGWDTNPGDQMRDAIEMGMQFADKLIVYNPQTNHGTMIKPNQLQKYLDDGYELNR